MSIDDTLYQHSRELARRLPATPQVAEYLAGMANGVVPPSWMEREIRLAWTAVSRARREELWLRMCAPDAVRLPRGMADVDEDLCLSMGTPEPLADRVLDAPVLGMTMYHAPPVGVWVYVSEWDYYFHSPEWEIVPCTRISASNVRPGRFIRMLSSDTCEVGVLRERTE